MVDEDRQTDGSQDIIDDALHLAEALQRKLVVAGMRRSPSSPATRAESSGDVWEEAVRREQPEQQERPLEQLAGIARTAGPEVATHLFRAGSTLFTALNQGWGVLERTLEEQRNQRSASPASGEDPPREGGRSH
ncbi:hypothetical protein FHX37_1939 [Haloactinospora alba]|uniref:Uncharacterized protein n=1 Tax=Haloactinospora alba TaxID=405555 RepID=A0A543NJP1_9ACTN|nr:hypothetical protein [Haloactinospora alba]TQN32014.1 hypothetical protein FHX37_1939 [Haloactinospora alba]